MYMNDFMEGAKPEFSVFANQKRKISDQRKEAPTSHLVFCAYLEKKSRRALMQVKKRIKKEVQGRKVSHGFPSRSLWEAMAMLRGVKVWRKPKRARLH